MPTHTKYCPDDADDTPSGAGSAPTFETPTPNMEPLQKSVPIDSATFLPADIYIEFLHAGELARDRAQHRVEKGKLQLFGNVQPERYRRASVLRQHSARQSLRSYDGTC
eukprot:NODE_17704_length_929_cov_11.406484.p2 GENE.NODE_17704_length_929_cov_11.406484~~NODE_17704_length_929_cov_11.406484.p2  ORF type:complete len:109 (+),score=12.92 NODE_17704_length_929_cov_11.406484:138-464(+)